MKRLNINSLVAFIVAFVAPLSLTASAVALSGCNNQKSQESAAENVEAAAETPQEDAAPGLLDPAKIVALIKDPTAEMAAECGLKLIYEDTVKWEEEPVEEYVAVYGHGVTKGDKTEFGYKLVPETEHACWFKFMRDTSTQAAIYFNNEQDAERFFGELVDYGLVIMGDTYLLPRQPLPDGSVKVDNLRDYDIVAQIDKPEQEELSGYYVIRISYYA